MDRVIAVDRFSSPHTWKKGLPVTALVLLLHIAFIAVMLFQKIAPAIAPQETVIPLPILPKQKVVVDTPQTPGAAQKKSYGTFNPPKDFQRALPDLSSLSFLLGKCNINTIGTLSTEDRARCRPMGGIDFAGVKEGFSGVSKAKRAEQYAAEVKAKNSPFRVPCTYMMVPEDGSSPAFMVHPICAAETIADTLDRIRRGDY